MHYAKLRFKAFISPLLDISYSMSFHAAPMLRSAHLQDCNLELSPHFVALSDRIGEISTHQREIHSENV
jgi:hypothetical protein